MAPGRYAGHEQAAASYARVLVLMKCPQVLLQIDSQELYPQTLRLTMTGIGCLCPTPIQLRRLLQARTQIPFFKNYSSDFTKSIIVVY